MTIHSAIDAVLRAHDIGIRPVLVDAIAAAVVNAQIDDRQPVGIDQGVSRLALRAFVSGLGLAEWNGSQGDGGSDQWVRYRGHHLDRETSDDGWIIAVNYIDHLGATMVARYLGGTGADTNTGVHVDQDWTAATLRAIDDLIDDILAHHGADSTSVVDAEVVEPITADQARRVLGAISEWIGADPERALHNPSDAFVAAVELGTVEP